MRPLEHEVRLLAATRAWIRAEEVEGEAKVERHDGLELGDLRRGEVDRERLDVVAEVLNFPASDWGPSTSELRL